MTVPTLKPLVLIGGGGHARVVIDVVRCCGEFEIVGCVVKDGGTAPVDDIPVLGNDDCLADLYERGLRHAVVAIGINSLRGHLSETVRSLGFELPIIIAPSAYISRSSSIDDGSVIMPRVVVNASVHVADGAILNTGSVIEHDCVLGRYVHVAPAGTLCGAVKLGDRVLVGAGATIVPSINVAADANVGAGAVVVHDILTAGTYVGVPAKPKLGPARANGRGKGSSRRPVA